MTGSSFLLDTNVVLYFLGGDQTLASAFDQKSLFLSTITELELLSYPGISEREEREIRNFISAITVIELNEQIKETAIYLDLPLFTADKDFEKINRMNLI